MRFTRVVHRDFALLVLRMHARWYRGKQGQEPTVSEVKSINWTNLMTLVSVAVLVGTEFVGIAWAAGWALGGLLQLSTMISHAVEILFMIAGLAALFYFMRQAIKYEPIRS